MILEVAGIEWVRLPAQSANLNAIAEGSVGSLKESCLERMVLIGESSLHRVSSEFALRSHVERNHQGLTDNPPRPHRISHYKRSQLPPALGRSASLLLPRCGVKTPAREFPEITGM